MKPFISPIWRQPPSDIAARIEASIKDVCAHFENTGPGYVYFRAEQMMWRFPEDSFTA
jgi:hypothetical protein